MTEVVILTGPPGSGKSTVAPLVAHRRERAVLLHTDDFWHSIVEGGIAPYLPEADVQNQVVVAITAATAFGYAAGGYTTVVDGIVGPWMLHHYRHSAAQHPGIGLHYVVLRPDRETALSRAQQRTSPDALVDPRPVLDLWEQFSDLGELDSHAIDNSHLSAESTADAVRAAIATDGMRLR